MTSSPNHYIPALKYHTLTRFYDPVVRIATRERTFKSALVKQAGIQSRQQILDLGCGTGTMALMLKNKYPETEVTGLDADDQVLRFAEAKASAAGAEVRFDRGLASELPYPDNRFDRVLSSLFFHHLSTQAKELAMQESLRVLRPGGEFHLADWGKPANALMRLLFLGVQLFDGYETTTDNVKGMLPEMLSHIGFEDVLLADQYSTLFGTLSLYRARKAVRGSGNIRVL